MKKVRIRRCMALVIGITSLFLSEPGEGREWSNVAEGLLLGRFATASRPTDNVDPVVILRIDPAKYGFRLLSALEQGGRTRTGRQWCEEFGLLAAINASMYKKNLQSTGYMRNYGHINNPSVNPAFGAFMAFNPKDPKTPRVKMVDSRTNRNWEEILEGYDSVVQNYRLISGGKKVKWPLQDQAHSIAAVGMDEAGHVLFIHGREPVSPHDFIDLLLSLPIQIRDAMYLEGGDEASLCVRVHGRWAEWSGVSEIDILRSLQINPSVPNALGITARVQETR